MNTLYHYLRDYWVIVVVALILAAINQVFSMLDPAILQRIIDRYATHLNEFTRRNSSGELASCSVARWAWRSSPAWPRTFRITTST